MRRGLIIALILVIIALFSATLYVSFRPNAEKITQEAVTSQDYSRCESLKDNPSKGEYELSECKRQVAIARHDYAYCDNLQLGQGKEYCISSIAVGTGNVLECEKVELYEGDPVPRDQCYREIAFTQRNISICNLSSSIQAKDYCTLFVVQPIRDASLCNSISELLTQEQCHLGVYLTRSEVNAEYCATLEFEINRDMCYINVALKTKDESLCENIVRAEWRSTCVPSIRGEI